MPALPLDEAGKYVAAAYVVFVLLLVIYIGIMAVKLGRLSRDLEELAEIAEGRAADDRRSDPSDEQLSEQRVEEVRS